MDWESIREEAVKYLQDLVRINTTNPPGNETPAAGYVADVLRKEGIEAQIVESEPGRGNVIARLKGSGEKGALLLLSHLDVVPVEPEHWEHDPFGGELIDGYIWGRGTVDTKQLTVMEMLCLLLAKREGLSLKRDLVLAATADEETGGKLGVEWLVKNRPELQECEYAINEGGGFGFDLGGKRYYLCDSAEKAPCWIKVKAKGTPGHASTPRGDNAVLKLAEAIARLGKARLPMHRTAPAEVFIKSLARDQKFPNSVLLPLVLNPIFEPLIMRQLPEDSEIKPMLRAMLHNTATPTILRAGKKTNVIPSEAEAEVDCRVLPGQTKEDLFAEIRPYLGEDIEIEVLTEPMPFETDYNTELFTVFQEVIAEEDPGAKVVPFMLTATTDSRFLARKGVKVYGFSPMKPDPKASFLELAHAHNERISVENLMFGVRVLYKIVKRFCT
ncbi:MAG: hypothetical protein DRI61_14975 [Chloroflexi bacterium]|nr:MAG: hypothetical protein DRI61_14975 [Chloroflexota bacterium]